METVLELQTMTSEQDTEQEHEIVAGARSTFSLACPGSNLSLLYCY